MRFLVHTRVPGVAATAILGGMVIRERGRNDVEVLKSGKVDIASNSDGGGVEKAGCGNEVREMCQGKSSHACMSVEM